MKHLTNIQDIEQAIADNRLCRYPPTMLSTSQVPPFYIKAPDCGVCNVMLDKVERLADGIILCIRQVQLVGQGPAPRHSLVLWHPYRSGRGLRSLLRYSS